MKFVQHHIFNISIHSLHTEGDYTGTYYVTDIAISIHSLHTEGDVFVFHVFPP